MSSFSNILSEVRFTRLQLRLEMADAFDFDLPALLQLRRELRQAAGLLILHGDAGLSSRVQRMLKPEEFQDPVARRRFRRPSPAFVFGWPSRGAHRLQIGDELLLPVSLWGHGRTQLTELLRLLDALGQIGLHHGQGRFRLLGASALDGAGGGDRLWEPGQPFNALEIPYGDLGWWLGQLPETDELQLEFLTPARVLSGNRPLFRPQPAELFTAMLRRVTGMIYAWSGSELPIDPGRMIELAAQLQPLAWNLVWRDWRQLQGESFSQDLGGLMGDLRLAGPGLLEIGWVFQLCALFNLGRGAAYGSGCCRISGG